MFGEGFWPTIGLLLVVLWLGSAVAGNTIHKVWAARLGSLAFVGHTIYLSTTMRPYGAEWFVVAIGAGIVGGFVYGGSQIALPILFAAHNNTLGQMSRTWQSRTIARQAAADERRRKKEYEEYRRRSQDEYERAAPERERQRQEEERRKAVAAQDARRRKDARAACELAYSRCAVEIGERFSRQELERFMGTYMGEEHTADDVERRGAELRQMMADYCQPPKPQKKKQTLKELTDWYQSEKQVIESLTLDELVRKEYVAALTRRHADMMDNLLQKLEP